MIEFKDYAVALKTAGIIQGIRPVFVQLLKGNYDYKGKYLTTINPNGLYFYQLKHSYKIKPRKPANFSVPFSELAGYRFAFYKEHYKKITLIFKDAVELSFIFMCGCEEAFDNEPNAMALMNTLKEKKIYQKNNLKEGNNGQKVISKSDQLFTQEVRNPKKKRGFFG